MPDAETDYYATWGGRNYGYLTYRQRVAWIKAMTFFKFADTNNTGQLTWSEYWVACYKIAARHGKIAYLKANYYKIKRQFYYWSARTGYKYMMSRKDVYVWIKRKVHEE